MWRILFNEPNTCVSIYLDACIHFGVTFRRDEIYSITSGGRIQMIRIILMRRDSFTFAFTVFDASRSAWLGHSHSIHAWCGEDKHNRSIQKLKCQTNAFGSHSRRINRSNNGTHLITLQFIGGHCKPYRVLINSFGFDIFNRHYVCEFFNGLFESHWTIWYVLRHTLAFDWHWFYMNIESIFQMLVVQFEFDVLSCAIHFFMEYSTRRVFLVSMRTSMQLHTFRRRL